MPEYGKDSLALLDKILGEGVDHVALLMRHSARHFRESKLPNDPENSLTEEGKTLARNMGKALPKGLTVRAYASPIIRCQQTAELLLDGYQSVGGNITRSRTIEALGAFYILDGTKWFMAVQEAGDQLEFCRHWFSGDTGLDIMMPSNLAAHQVARVVTEKLKYPVAKPQVDLLVSHDLTLYLLKDQLLHQPADVFGQVKFLDALAFYVRDGELMIRSHHSVARTLSFSLN